MPSARSSTRSEQRPRHLAGRLAELGELGRASPGRRSSSSSARRPRSANRAAARAAASDGVVALVGPGRDQQQHRQVGRSPGQAPSRSRDSGSSHCASSRMRPSGRPSAVSARSSAASRPSSEALRSLGSRLAVSSLSAMGSPSAAPEQRQRGSQGRRRARRRAARPGAASLLGAGPARQPEQPGPDVVPGAVAGPGPEGRRLALVHLDRPCSRSSRTASTSSRDLPRPGRRGDGDDLAAPVGGGRRCAGPARPARSSRPTIGSVWRRCRVAGRSRSAADQRVRPRPRPPCPSAAGRPAPPA